MDIDEAVGRTIVASAKGYRLAVNDAVHDVNLLEVASFGDRFAFAVLVAAQSRTNRRG